MCDDDTKDEDEENVNDGWDDHDANPDGQDEDCVSPVSIGVELE